MKYLEKANLLISLKIMRMKTFKKPSIKINLKNNSFGWTWFFNDTKLKPSLLFIWLASLTKI